MRAFPLFAALLLAGCADPYESPDAPPAATASEGSTAGTAADEEPERLAEGGNEQVRLALDDHRIAGSKVSLFVTVQNKDPNAVLRTRYANLGTQSGVGYFDFAAEIGPEATRRFELTNEDGETFMRDGWVNLSLFYTVDSGAEFDDDEAVLLDLSGRGLPSNVA